LAFCAAHRLAEPFVWLAERDDREQYAAAAHQAVALIADGRFARQLGEVARPIGDAARAFLLELSVALLQRGSASVFETSPSLALQLGDDDFSRLAQVFRDAAGLHFDASVARRLESRLLPRVRASKKASFRAYVDLLRSGTADGEQELLRAVDRVTIHETYFYREHAQLLTFRDRGLDHARSLGGHPIRILSAGCATGEEAYTLSMMTEDYGLASADVGIVGIDISEEVIEYAAAGVYGRRGLRGELPESFHTHYFDTIEGGKVRVRPKIKERVGFLRRNLAHPADLASLGRFHIIFCRNVLIYLAQDVRERLIESFFNQLVPGGLLFLGHSESLLHMTTRFRFVASGNELLYVRPLDSGEIPEGLTAS